MNPNIYTVADLLTENHRWNYNIISNMFCEEDTRMIMQTPVSHTNRPDTIMWTKDNRGSYSVKIAYKDLLDNREENVRNLSQDWSSLWKSQLPPKLLLFIWKCLHNSLPLGTNLLKKHFQIDGSCAFGCENTEDDKHLFLDFQMTRAAWF